MLACFGAESCMWSSLPLLYLAEPWEKGNWDKDDNSFLAMPNFNLIQNQRLASIIQILATKPQSPQA